ncbi:hypothetical protein PIB30_054304 [Stylosanthes scabra]|uniref:Uncharacterized protein n=1 Tax=Stylosanthes scabra TaxID=79078 RepID=A0ABU6ZHL1_9FABA|nr:hypothetical protein [Stylosanthes scabra]
MGVQKTRLNELAWARGPWSSWSESSKREGADAPRSSCGRTAVRARHVRSTNAPHTCVASAECHYAHRTDVPKAIARASEACGHANKMVRIRLEELYHGGVSPT